MTDWRQGVYMFLGRCASQVGANENEPFPELGTTTPATPGPAPAPPSDTPPRLVRALNTTPVTDATTLPLYTEFQNEKGGDLDFANPGNLEIRYLIRHIYDRLKEPFVDAQGQATAGSPWSGSDGGTQPPAGQYSADEHYARLMAELFSLSPYTLPSTVYSGLQGMKFTDGNFLYKLQDDEDPAYPIVLECQQSVTAAALGRGFSLPLKPPPVDDPLKTPKIPLPEVNHMFSAGPSETPTNALIPSGQAKWVSYQVGSTQLSKLDPDFGPGSAFSFNDSLSGTTQFPSDHPHIAFAIRVRRDANNKVEAIQFFDVGGMNVPETPEPAMPARTSAAQGYAYEYPWSTSGKEGALGKYAGHSVLAPAADTRAKGISRLASGRPLGLARLVIAKRHNAVKQRDVDFVNDPPAEWLLYASPYLRMYEDDPGKNYSITRYLWSLRGLPGAEHIQAIWMISTPRSELADCMAFGLGPIGNRTPTGRTTTLKQMVIDAAARKPTWNLNTAGTGFLSPHISVLGVIDVTVESDGTVSILDSCKSDFKTSGFTFMKRDGSNNGLAGAYALGHLPWGKAKTYAANIDLTTFTDLPEYFKDVT